MIAEAIHPPGSCRLSYSTRSISLAQIRSPGACLARTVLKHSACLQQRLGDRPGRHFSAVPSGFPRAERKLRDAAPAMQIGCPCCCGAHAATCQSGSMAPPPALASDSLAGLVLPMWQLVIGLLVLVAVVGSVHRLVMRGPTRMGGAMLLVGGAVVCIAVVSYLVEQI